MRWHVAKQRDLFPPPPTISKTEKVREPYRIEPFDFLRDGDAAACIPQPEVVIPEELRLPTDDERWQPGSG